MAKLIKAARRDRRRKRIVANQKRGGTLAGQLRKMQVSRGYARRRTK